MKKKRPARRIRQSPKLPAPERRQQLLEAAFTLFMKKGYRATTTEEIARSVGLTKGALYFHYKNKEELVIEIVGAVCKQIFDTIEAIPREKATPAVVFRSLVEAKLGFPEADFANYLDLWGQAVRIKKVRRMIREMYEQFDLTFADRISLNYSKPLKQRLDVALLIGAIYDGLWSRMLITGEEPDVKRITRLIEKLIPQQKATKSPGM